MATISRYFKPLPPAQPREAPANLNTPLSEKGRQKRESKHAAMEATRAPEQKLMSRDDLGARAQKTYSLQWLKRMDSIMRLWCEFFQAKLNRIDGPITSSRAGRSQIDLHSIGSSSGWQSV